MHKSLTNPQFCQRLVTVSATGADGRPVIVPWHRECLQRGWGELLTAMNPGEDPVTLILCSNHYAEELTKASPVADVPKYLEPDWQNEADSLNAEYLKSEGL